VQTFDFLGMVGAFDRARGASPGLTSWALTNALLQFHLSGADDFALGGDLAYWYAKNRGFGGISLAAAQQVIGAAGFGSVTVSGGCADTSSRCKRASSMSNRCLSSSIARRARLALASATAGTTNTITITIKNSRIKPPIRCLVAEACYDAPTAAQS